MTRRGAGGLALMVALELSCRSAAPLPPLPAYLRDPREGLSGSFPRDIAEGWRKLQARDAESALRHFEASPRGAASLVGRIECQLELGRPEAARELCTGALEQGLDTAPLLAACGEAEARLGDRTEAFNFFEGAALRAPGSAGLARLRDEAAPLAAGEWVEHGIAARQAGETADARSDAERALAIDPANEPALRLAGETALEEKDYQAAFRRFSAAWNGDPLDLALGEQAGEMALRTERYETASRIFATLSASDPRFRARKREADEEFVISNWPASDRAAAHASRLTRAQAALLVWRLVPQVRWAPARAAAPVASDIVAREDRKILSRCLQLGLISIDETTHRARPDAPLRRGEELHLLRRVAALRGSAARLPEEVRRGGRTGPVSGEELRRALRELEPAEGKK